MSYKVVDQETGNYCIYEGQYLLNAFEAIRYAAKSENDYAEEFQNCEDWDLYKDEERIWCGKTDTIAELCDVCFTNPKLGKKVKDYRFAMFNWGSDPIYIEEVEQAISVFLMMNDDGVVVDLLNEKEDLEDAWLKLDLTEEKPSDVYCCGKYNEEHWYICFEEDYV